MIVLISFTEMERHLFDRAAKAVGIAPHVRYIEPKDAMDMEVLHSRRRGGKGFPKVLILNLDDTHNDWRDVLNTLKQDASWKNIPVMGISFLEDPKIVEDFYRLRGASCIRKPETYADLLSVTRKTMSYWLNVATLPNEILAS